MKLSRKQLRNIIKESIDLASMQKIATLLCSNEEENIREALFLYNNIEFTDFEFITIFNGEIIISFTYDEEQPASPYDRMIQQFADQNAQNPDVEIYDGHIYPIKHSRKQRWHASLVCISKH